MAFNSCLNASAVLILDLATLVIRAPVQVSPGAVRGTLAEFVFLLSLLSASLCLQICGLRLLSRSCTWLQEELGVQSGTCVLSCISVNTRIMLGSE